uniref:glutathione transferase n=2 Tax=Steinernema glaseri TaxID=37863 RepID=A0A1I7YRV2_9BILA
MPSYKLTYFPIRGLAEPARLLFHLAGVEFEDNRIEQEAWPALKPNTPFGQLPVLEFDGKVLAQSYAIYRYLANEFGFAGKCNFEKAIVDMIADSQKDFGIEVREYFRVAAGMAEGDASKLYEEKVKPAAARHLPLLVKYLKESGSGFFVKSGVTWVDLLIVEQLNTFKNFQSDILNEYPELDKFIETVRSLPQLKEYVEKRPVTQF